MKDQSEDDVYQFTKLILLYISNYHKVYSDPRKALWAKYSAGILNTLGGTEKGKKNVIFSMFNTVESHSPLSMTPSTITRINLKCVWATLCHKFCVIQPVLCSFNSSLP